MAHPWVQGPTATEAEVLTEFKRRKEEVDAVIAQEAQQKKTDRAEKANKRRAGVARGDGAENEFDKLLHELYLNDDIGENQPRKMTDFEPDMNKNT